MSVDCSLLECGWILSLPLLMHGEFSYAKLETIDGLVMLKNSSFQSGKKENNQLLT